jgi:hypothetical protein
MKELTFVSVSGKDCQDRVWYVKLPDNEPCDVLIMHGVGLPCVIAFPFY